MKRDDEFKVIDFLLAMSPVLVYIITLIVLKTLGVLT